MSEEQFKQRILNLRKAIIEALDEFGATDQDEPDLENITSILENGLYEDDCLERGFE